jgi:hypothetical protein
MYNSSEVVNILIIASGLSIVALKMLLRKLEGRNILEDSSYIYMDFINGCTAVPFVLMILSSLSSQFGLYFESINPVILAISGTIGLIFVLQEVFIRNRRH